MDRDSILEFQLEKPTAPDSAQNYEFLRAKGLELVQRYAGSKWTDYNLHDPGVTILEYLCYAITDLAYRTGFDIKEILTGKDGKIDLDKNLFYPKHQILTSKPILVNDFRKFIIDRIPAVHNVWIVPVADIKGKAGIRGLYHVLIQVNNGEADLYLHEGVSAEERQAYKIKISEQVKAVVNSQRSLGEDYESFIVLDPADIEIQAEVVVEKHQMHEEILADVYDKLIRTITPPIHFYSEEQLEKEGWSVEDIYCGPSLKHGFIKDEELKDRVSILDPSDMIQSILNVQGVKYVRNFVIKFNGAEYDFRPAYLEAGMFPRLVFDIHNPGIKVFNTSHELPVKASIFSGLLHKKTDNSKRKYIKGYGYNERKSIVASHRQIETYFSIQHLFPHLYRLNDNEIEGAKVIKEQDAKERAEKAKVKQLKAYIMLFEQVMVNYLAQLANVSNILTADINIETASSTYFTGNLQDVPGAGNILADFMRPNANLNHVDWEYFKDDPNNAYLTFLSGAIEPDEMFFDRKKRILDHLLSRFDINLVKYPLQLYYQLYQYGDDKVHRFAELEWKSDILKRIVSFGTRRNQALDYTDQFSDTRSGYDSLMAALLYLPESGTKNISQSYEESLGQCSITSSNRYESAETGKKGVYEMRWDDERIEMIISESLLESLLTPGENNSETIEETKIHVPAQKISFLKEGIDHKYYRIGQEIDGKGFIVLYRPPEKRQWLRIGKFVTREKAQQELNQFIDTLKQISISSEGFHTLEHILLRPEPEAKVFGFQIFDDKGLLLLQQNDWVNFNKRTDIFDIIVSTCKRIAETGDYSIFAELDGVCQVNLSQDRNYTWLVSPKTLQIAYREQLNQFVKKVMHTLELLQQEPLLKYPTIKNIVTYSNGLVLDEQFFSFSMSVIMPAWPARFQENDFREFAESLFREHAPAHMRQQFFWLSVKEMKRFESVYFAWLQSLQQTGVVGLVDSLLSKELMAIIAGSQNISS